MNRKKETKRPVKGQSEDESNSPRNALRQGGAAPSVDRVVISTWARDQASSFFSFFFLELHVLVIYFPRSLVVLQSINDGDPGQIALLQAAAAPACCALVSLFVSPRNAPN